MSEKKSRTEELITEPFIIDNPKTAERLLDVLESPGKPIKESNCRQLSNEELWAFIEKVIKERNR